MTGPTRYALLLALVLPCCGGNTERAANDASGLDHRTSGDAGPSNDGTVPDGTGLADGTAEGPPADGAGTPDVVAPDLHKPDLMVAPDTAAPTPDKGTPPGPLSVPCNQGPGWTLFRFHYAGGSKSPQIDVWDASCSYSYAPNSACNVYAVYPGFGSVSYTSQGYPILTSSEYLRVRFSVAGLSSFTKAAVHIQARSYATASSTYYRVWSPLYGGLVDGPVDNDWIYDWYSLDWSNHLKPGDKPSLTAIQIYGDKGSGKLAVKTVELCVQ